MVVQYTTRQATPSRDSPAQPNIVTESRYCCVMRNHDSGNATPSQVQSVDRAISVLELLARNGESGITEIAGELGVHKSTASRLLSVLEARGVMKPSD